jgi:hypothetical protein
MELQERDPVPDEVFRLLLDLYMVNDPWPLSDRENGQMLGFLIAECHKRGYESWTRAYHEFEP